MFIYFSVHVTSQQSSSLLMRKVIYKQVRFILNWIFSLISLYSLIHVLQDTTYKLNTVYILQYMSRSSFIAMTNHMIIMVYECDSCMFVFTCIMQNRYYYIWYNHHSLSNHKWFFYHNVLLSMPYHVEMLLPKRSNLHFYLSIFSIQIPHTNSSKLQTKSRSFIDYNDQSNNPECTVYLHDSFLHMSRDFLSIIDVIVLFSHKTLIRCHFNFSIVEFNCDDNSTFLCIPNQCLCLVELYIVTTLSEF